MTSQLYFLGVIFKIGDGYCLRRVFLHIYAKFQDVSIKTVAVKQKSPQEGDEEQQRE